MERNRRGRVETSSGRPGAIRPRQTVTSQIGAALMRVDGRDGARNEKNDVVVIVVVVEPGNPRRVRGAGVGTGGKREQDAQEESSN